MAIPQELLESLTALNRREGSTLFMTLLAVFKTLLYRYTGCEDVVVGTGIASRKSVEVENLIGFFVNHLVLRTRFSGKQTFSELLAMVRETAIAAYTHQDLPFEKLVGELQPERSLSRSPLFQIMFMMQNVPSTGLHLHGVTARPLMTTNSTAKFDLTMYVIPAGDGLGVLLEYNTLLFDTDRMTRLLGHFQSLLQFVATDAEQQICDLPLLTAQERFQLLVEFNDTNSIETSAVCVHELIAAQAERTPDAIAIEFDGAQLTYREMNRRANQLAHFLQRSGVGPDVVVGLCLERSPEMVIGILGILKAGAAYLPLDPALPEQRLSFILEQARVSVTLTQQTDSASVASGDDYGDLP